MSGLPIFTKTSFTAGELDLDLAGRGDLSLYGNGAKALRNVVVAPTGGVRRRPGLRHVAGARGPGRLIAFEFNTEQTYLLALSAGRLDVYADGERIADLSAPWSTAQIAQIGWTQNADTLLVVHPDVPPRKITRTAAGWTMEEWSFYMDDSGVLQVPSHKFAADAVTLTPGGTSGTITLTASASVFQAGHVGLRFRIGGKQVLITSVSSPTQATAEIKQSLASTSATKDWEEQTFSALRGWPASVCFHQGRLVIGGSRDLPNRLWLSKSGDLFNFDLGTGLDDEAIEFALLADQVDSIRAVFPGRHLQVFTSGAEWMVVGAPVTPEKIQLSRQTRIGSPADRTVPPRDVDGATHFVSRNGRELREFLFTDVDQVYQANDLAMVARHVLNAPVDQDYDSGRRLFHVVMGDGTLGTLTVYRGEKVTAWSVYETEGAFRSVAVTDGETHVLVERDGTFTIERFDDSLYLDAALSGERTTSSGVWSGLEHLEGREVTVLMDGSAIARATVSGGSITLPRPAAAIVAGLPYTHRIEPLPPQAGGSQPMAAGTAVRLVQACFRVLDTQALHIDTGRGPVAVPFRRRGADRFSTRPTAFSGDVKVRAIGWTRDVMQPLWRIEQNHPLPCTVISVSTEIKGAE